MWKLIRPSLDAVWETKWFWLFGILSIILAGSPLFQVSNAFKDVPKDHFSRLLTSLPLSFIFSFLLTFFVIIIVSVLFESLLIGGAHAKQKKESFQIQIWFHRLRKTFLRLFTVSLGINLFLSLLYVLFFFSLSAWFPEGSWRESFLSWFFIVMTLSLFLIQQYLGFGIFLKQESLPESVKQVSYMIKKHLSSLLSLCFFGLLITVLIFMAKNILAMLFSLLFSVLAQSAIVYKLITLFKFLGILSVVIDISLTVIFHGFILCFWVYLLLLSYKQYR